MIREVASKYLILLYACLMNSMKNCKSDTVGEKNIKLYGNEIHSFPLVKHGGNVTGIDISRGSIEIANERSVEEGVSDKYNFRVGDCESFDFHNNYFDIVFEAEL